MAKLIMSGRIVQDDWQIVFTEEGVSPEATPVPEGRAIVPLTVWLARRDELSARPEIGVWLAGNEDPADVADDIAKFPVIAVNFPKFADGRGYSVAALLRRRYGYTGELRAIGDVLRDQFNYLTRCGFDALQPQADKYTDTQLAAALASIGDFTEPYQASTQPADPLFRRVQRAA